MLSVTLEMRQTDGRGRCVCRKIGSSVWNGTETGGGRWQRAPARGGRLKHPIDPKVDCVFKALLGTGSVQLLQ